MRWSSCEALLSAVSSLTTPHDDLRVDAVYTGDLVTPAEELGVWGMLPLFGFSNGDTVMLRARPKRPIEEWPVVRVDHAGGDATTFASSLQSLVPGWLAAFGRPSQPRSWSALRDARSRLATVDAALTGGDGTARLWALHDEGGWRRDTPLAALYRLFEPADAFHRSFLEAREDATLTTWRAYLKRHAHFAPAWHLAFGAALRDGTDDAAAAAPSIAWQVVQTDDTCDSYFGAKWARDVFAEEPRRVAARLLLALDDDHEWRRDPVWRVVSALDDDRAPLSAAWLLAARELEDAGKLVRAHLAYRNAGRARFDEEKAPWSSAYDGLLRIARRNEDEDMVWLLERHRS